LVASILDLHEDYSTDEDIALFLSAKFAEIQRRYHVSPSWCPRDAIPTLVGNASGQFIYAATVVRFIKDSGRIGDPQTLLHFVLQMGINNSASQLPFAQIDALSSHVLRSSPNPASLDCEFGLSVARAYVHPVVKLISFFKRWMVKQHTCSGTFTHWSRFRHPTTSPLLTTCVTSLSLTSSPTPNVLGISALSTGNRKSSLCPDILMHGAVSHSRVICPPLAYY
jgi:hypothetical protein